MPRLQKGESKYKYSRDDVIRRAELDRILDSLANVDYMGLPGKAWQCLVAILWLFGKRISEVIRLKTADININSEDNMLSIRFLVLKKESRKTAGVLKLYTKRITLDNPYTEYIMSYLSSLAAEQWNEPSTYDDMWVTIDEKLDKLDQSQFEDMDPLEGLMKALNMVLDKDEYDEMEAALSEYIADYLNADIGFLFPREQTKTGHIFREYAWHVLKKVNVNLWPHLFRHSLATQMAEERATAFEMIKWFDWENTDTALEYIERSGRLTERLSNRLW